MMGRRGGCSREAFYARWYRGGRIWISRTIGWQASDGEIPTSTHREPPVLSSRSIVDPIQFHGVPEGRCNETFPDPRRPVVIAFRSWGYDAA